ncbi:MAG: LysR family transcriptional regulator [Myxococcota bacterium]|nr:LysR family transcriptional regulator [Myxococcota bacterium]
MQPYGFLPDLDSLRCFVEAAKYLNFRAASRAVGLTPAALGQRIRQLEEQLEVTLFHRTTRRVELTEAGLSLLPAAHRALDTAVECVRAARGELGPAPLDLRMGTRSELGLSWITPMLPRLREVHPNVTVHLYVGSGQDLENRVRSQEIDCAVSSRRIHDPRIEGIRLHREDYVFVGSTGLLGEQPLEVEAQAAEHELLDIAPELPLYSYFREAPDAPTLRFERVRSLGTIAAVRAEVLLGMGVAILPEYLVRGDLAEGKLHLLFPKVEILHDYFRLIHRRDDPRKVFLRAIAETMRAEPLQ